ncbi:kinetochore protein Spc25 [Drosophila rhopaloa]|uniref:Kinetochore protein Spc25 n=1 Tax=Drosophila rhopaloa TaxID=1041015 RepID=A0A6P4ENM4_DRORH|nr:kinetochore protein Spc25 [Drosophila rhopaloa]
MAITMNGSSYEKRIKAVYDKQIRLQVREANVIKKVSKFKGHLLDVKEAVVRHQREVGKLQKVIMQRREEVEKRVSFMEELSKDLEATRQRNLVLKEQIKQRKMLARKRDNEIMESIHTLKQATGTYINNDALPARVKGVTALRTADGDQFLPFNLRATDVEGLDSLCQHLQTFNIDVSQWRHLISLAAEMSTDSHATPTTPPKEATKFNPIIEIDLTSPTSQT